MNLKDKQANQEIACFPLKSDNDGYILPDCKMLYAKSRDLTNTICLTFISIIDNAVKNNYKNDLPRKCLLSMNLALQ